MMNLKNKTDKELWDIRETVQGKIFILKIKEYDIEKEIIRREKDNDLGKR